MKHFLKIFGLRMLDSTKYGRIKPWIDAYISSGCCASRYGDVGGTR